jgi:hypothetical protein
MFHAAERKCCLVNFNPGGNKDEKWTKCLLLGHQSPVKSLLILIITLIFLSGCYSANKSYGVAYIYKNETDSFEIQIPYRIKGRGSQHNFTFEKFEDSSSDYIVFRHLQKMVAADSLKLIYQKGYSLQSNLKGDISLNDSSLIINFKIPRNYLFNISPPLFHHWPV